MSLAVRRIGDTGTFTNQHIRPPGVPPVCQHESHSLDASHKPLSAENWCPGGLQVSCLLFGRRGAVVLFDWPERAIKEGADNMMGKSANEIIRKCVSGG